MAEFTAESLPRAIRALFEVNQYEVIGPIKVHGAEIDLVARSKRPFDSSIYIEATIEYVDNTKYGKDLTKLVMVPKIEPGAKAMIVSSKGFTPDVAERAGESNILTLTYDELFRKFEKFDGYLAKFTGLESPSARELADLMAIYEEPYFEDRAGRDLATGFLTRWRDDPAAGKGWLIIAGDYGTGKTALTKVLQRRWLDDYRENPRPPIPFRIELRHFVRQFDARGLLHHFLDLNALGHVPIEFVSSLIRDGRVLLLLDGYDEMAQYLSPRERRACLEALAELSAGGARGILTSRPNYFTEAEELQVFEILYASLDRDRSHLGREAAELAEHERRVDRLLEQFLDRYERSLKDLTPDQTESLVRRALAGDDDGCEVVLGILRRIAPPTESHERTSLSGKPVIISYLLEVVEGLKKQRDEGGTPEALSEWQVYELIVDQLMYRDLRRTPEMVPDVRRRFLHALSVFLSRREHRAIDEQEFKGLITREFAQELRLAPQGQPRTERIEQLFANLRGSTTLTRGDDPGRGTWRFSHNSLREFLLAEHLLQSFEAGRSLPDGVPVSDAMRSFVASLSEHRRRSLLRSISDAWGERSALRGVGQVLTLAWDALLPLFAHEAEPAAACLKAIAGSPIALNSIELTRLELSSLARPSSLPGANLSGSTLAGVWFAGANLREADFSESLLEAVRFSGAALRGAKFRGALIVDSELTGADVEGADFRGVDPNSISLVVDDEEAVPGERRLEGVNALAYLRFRGAETDAVPVESVLRFHPKFEIVRKIIDRLAAQPLHQRLGLEQRGAAKQDVSFARELVAQLESQGLIATKPGRRELIETTEEGREAFVLFARSRAIPPQLLQRFALGRHTRIIADGAMVA